MTPATSGELELPTQVSSATQAHVEVARGPRGMIAADSPEVTSRVDLIFYDVDHSGPSYEARVFADNPDAGIDTPRTPESGYLGAFTVFGHGGCYGDVGHCDIDQGTHDAFDVRPQHPLTPWTKTVILPPEGIAILTGESVRLTVVAVSMDGEVLDLEFSRVRLAAYSP
jgi:hypothetical protein